MRQPYPPNEWVSLATLFGFCLLSPVKHQGECKLLLSHTLLHGLCLPDARDYRRCNLPASQVSKPTNGLFQIALKKRPKFFLPGGDSNSGPPRRMPRLNDLHHGAFASDSAVVENLGSSDSTTTNSAHLKKAFSCSYCHRTFIGKGDLTYHVRT